MQLQHFLLEYSSARPLSIKYIISGGATKSFRQLATTERGIGGGGRVSAQGVVHMAAVLAGCRKALVGTGWNITLFFNTNWCR